MLTIWHSIRMPRGYSRDLRERLLQAEASGLSIAEITRATGVSPKSIRRWKQTQAAGESLEPGHPPGPQHTITPEQEPVLRALVAAHPDATLAEHCAVWAQTQTEVSVSTMSRTLGRLGITRKKRR